jgi:hypothetical protein
MSQKTTLASTDTTRGEPKPIPNIIGGRQLEAGATARDGLSVCLDAADEGRSDRPPLEEQAVRSGQPAEHVRRVGLQVLRQAEHRSLRDRHGAQLAGPVVGRLVKRSGTAGQLSGEPSETSLGLVGQQPSAAAGEWQQPPTVEHALARTTPPDTRTRQLHRTSSAERPYAASGTVHGL